MSNMSHAEFHDFDTVMLSVIMLSVVMLSVVAPCSTAKPAKKLIKQLKT